MHVLSVRRPTTTAPGPQDLVWLEYEDSLRRPLALRPEPVRPGTGSDLPSGLWPLVVPTVEKIAEAPAWWPLNLVVRWLVDSVVPPPALRDDGREAAPYSSGPLLDERVSVAIDARTRRADPGRLYMTRALAFADDEEIAVAVDAAAQDFELLAALRVAQGLHPLGGERRLADVRVDPTSPSAWMCPPGMAATLARARRVRLALMTPAAFDGGWRPGWLDVSTLTGKPPGAAVQLRLIAAAVSKPVVQSGWDIVRRAPKGLRRLVPAGSVYWFEVVAGDPRTLASLWLKSVSDDPLDRVDGLGVAAWGVWPDDEDKCGEAREVDGR
jgi:CRISPR-associated protein Cmr3